MGVGQRAVLGCVRGVADRVGDWGGRGGDVHIERAASCAGDGAGAVVHGAGGAERNHGDGGNHAEFAGVGFGAGVGGDGDRGVAASGDTGLFGGVVHVVAADVRGLGDDEEHRDAGAGDRGDIGGGGVDCVGAELRAASNYPEKP